MAYNLKLTRDRLVKTHRVKDLGAQKVFFDLVDHVNSNQEFKYSIEDEKSYGLLIKCGLIVVDENDDGIRVKLTPKGERVVFGRLRKVNVVERKYRLKKDDPKNSIIYDAVD